MPTNHPCPHCGASTYAHTPTPDDRPRRRCCNQECRKITIIGEVKPIGRPKIHADDADRKRKEWANLTPEQKEAHNQRQRKRRARKKLEKQGDGNQGWYYTKSTNIHDLTRHIAQIMVY